MCLYFDYNTSQKWKWIKMVGESSPIKCLISYYPSCYVGHILVLQLSLDLPILLREKNETSQRKNSNETI